MLIKQIRNWAVEEETIVDKQKADTEIRIEKVSFLDNGEVTKVTFSVEKIEWYGRLHHTTVKYVGLEEIDAFRVFIETLKTEF